VFVPDRGADYLYVYHVSGPHDVTQVHNITFPPGTGPRHITFKVFSHSKTFMYLVSELDNTVRVFALDGLSNTPSHHARERSIPRGTLDITLLQTASTLQAGSNRTAPNNHDLAGEIAISSDGKFAYASNRNTVSYSTDTLTIYSVHPNSSEHLVYLGRNATYGKIPRHFSLSSDFGNKYVAVANEISNNIIVLERDAETGFMKGIVGNLTLGEFDMTELKGPMAVIWD